ncbi:MAG: PIN domain-containing protein [Spirochaetaceae bacterium]|nr:MAG: PIN domain-containing protein [Spirochaetaceae bacterium]
MIGIDTSFLVAFEVKEHPSHESARRLAREHANEGFALAPQVVAEFAHVVTDARRFKKPLSMEDALGRAATWWDGSEVTQVRPDAAAVSLFLSWMRTYGLGRKRLLDTMLAATYKTNGVSLVLSSNWRDFALFPGMHPIAL